MTMRIHSVELTNVRGIDHLKIEDLPDTGVIVIHGDNEAGKSTIVEAINVVLSQKHSSASKKHISPLQPAGKDVGPEITLEATVGPHRFRITKRFLRKKKSELTVFTPVREAHAGSDADNRLTEILDSHLDKNLRENLFLRQDDLNDGIKAAGISSLTEALEAFSEQDGATAGAHAAATGASEDTALMAAVEREYQRYFTERSGKRTGEYDSSTTRLEEAQAAFDDAQSKLSALDQFVEKYERVQAKQEQAQRDLPGKREELAKHKQAAEEAAKLADAAGHLATQHDLAVKVLGEAREKLRQREELKEDLEKTSRELAQVRQDVEAAQAKNLEDSEKIGQLDQQLESAKDDYERARRRLQRARAAEGAAARLRRKKELDEQLTALDKLDAQLAEAKTIIAGRPRDITDDDVRRVDEAVSEVRLHERLHAAAAAKLTFTAKGTEAIRVDGDEVELGATPRTVELRDGMEFVIGAVTATYAGGDAGQSVRSKQEALEKARTALTGLLDQLGVADVESVRELRETQREENEQLDRLRREFNLVIGGKDLTDLRAERDGLAEQIAHSAAADGEQAGGEESDAEELTSAVATAEEAEEAAREAVANAEAQLKPWRERSGATELVRKKAALEGLEDKESDLRRRLAQAQDKATDSDLAAAVEAAVSECDQRAQALEQAQQRLVEADPDIAQKRLAGAQSEVEALDSLLRQAEVDLARLDSDIRAHTGAAESRDIARAELEAATRAFESVERRAKAAAYLRELLHRHRDAARKRYAEPFSQRLAALARTVYGGQVQFELSDELEVTGRTRDDVTVGMDDLSGGAKEQLAILTRFAIADLVAEASKARAGQAQGASAGVPVVIDDALGSTDSSRLELMAMLFADSGRSSQVIVFTCVPQRYSRVPGRVELDIEELKS